MITIMWNVIMLVMEGNLIDNIFNALISNSKSPFFFLVQYVGKHLLVNNFTSFL